jgi:hypothetical protein
MPYFPIKAEPTPYQCEGCKEWYKVPSYGVTISCTVLHPQGSCCHYGEIALEKASDGRLVAKQVPSGGQGFSSLEIGLSPATTAAAASGDSVSFTMYTDRNTTTNHTCL